MLTVIKNGEWTGVQYPENQTAENEAEIRAFHASQGEQVIDRGRLTRFVDKSTTPPTVSITTPPPSQADIDLDTRSWLKRVAVAEAQKRINDAAAADVAADIDAGTLKDEAEVRGSVRYKIPRGTA